MMKLDNEMTAATETAENKDCGKLPQNQKDKKNKWLLLVISIATVIIAGLLTTQFLSKDNEPKDEPIDYMQYVEGIEDLELTATKDKYDYLSGITFDKEQINSVTVDDSQVDLTKAGEYQLTYLINVKNEKYEDLKQAVTVKVVSDDKKEEPKKDSDKKDNTSTSSKPNSDGSSTNGGNNTTTKPNNTSSTNSQPSNSGSSSNTNKKPTSPTHTHHWTAVTKTVHHEAQGHYETVTISEAWNEDIYEDVFYMKCNGCGYKSYTASEYEAHASIGFGHGGFTDVYETIIVDTIHHPAKTEKKWVIDSEAYDETVTTGYKCSCGATK